MALINAYQMILSNALASKLKSVATWDRYNDDYRIRCLLKVACGTWFLELGENNKNSFKPNTKCQY